MAWWKELSQTGCQREGRISQAGSQREGEISRAGSQREGEISQVGCQREVSRAGSQREELVSISNIPSLNGIIMLYELVLENNNHVVSYLLLSDSGSTALRLSR